MKWSNITYHEIFSLIQNFSSNSIRITESFVSFFFPVTLKPNAGHGLLILEVSMPHSSAFHCR